MNTFLQQLLVVSLLSTSHLTIASNTANNNLQVSLTEQNKLVFTDCHLDGIKEQVKCGYLTVPENYSLKDSAQISINFAVLPAIDESNNNTPLMFLAGGPGQAAVELASGLRMAFSEIRKTRDIILVDQRGTGMSHALECKEISVDQNVYQIIPEDFSEQEIKDCIAEFTGDLSQYNSENAIRDFDGVREALGHEKINIYGGSYGTRAALVYMRMFPESLRSVVLDSVGPIEVPIGLFGQSSAQSFKLVLEHCQQEDVCHNAYPNLVDEFHQLIRRLTDKPITITIPHPRLGTNTEFIISKSKLLSTIFQQLYSLPSRNLIPLIIHQAFLNNYMPLAGLIAMTDEVQMVYTGLLFNITCNEDFPKITAEMLAKDADNSFAGDNSQLVFKKACAIWPKYRPSEEFYQSVTADIPTLILSGGLDPVTPPSNGEFSASTLPNSHHIIVDNVSHGVATSTGKCGVLIINEFLSRLTPNKLDETCLEELPAESFMTSLNGGNISRITSKKSNNLNEINAMKEKKSKGDR
ncbi:MAG: pimeloyl-ACP methyl ester carboxylesterase [Alteromonadaceae bacterium]|jgi:pimeloyl-ACP methyl ester carboxylesterase